jgi:hypothetical protein
MVWGIGMGEESSKVRSGKGVGNRSSERSVKVTSGYVRNRRKWKEEIKWACRARYILLRKIRQITSDFIHRHIYDTITRYPDIVESSNTRHCKEKIVENYFIIHMHQL